MGSFQSEPIRWTEIVLALFGLAAAFGLDISEETRNAILGVMPVLFIAFEFIRSKVFAPDTVDRMQAEHKAEIDFLLNDTV